jgi:hypothetical protein
MSLTESEIIRRLKKIRIPRIETWEVHQLLADCLGGFDKDLPLPVVEAALGVLERHPSFDDPVMYTIIHAVEKLPSEKYLPIVLASLKRKPSAGAARFVLRILNAQETKVAGIDLWHVARMTAKRKGPGANLCAEYIEEYERKQAIAEGKVSTDGTLLDYTTLLGLSSQSVLKALGARFGKPRKDVYEELTYLSWKEAGFQLELRGNEVRAVAFPEGPLLERGHFYQIKLGSPRGEATVQMIAQLKKIRSRDRIIGVMALVLGPASRAADYFSAAPYEVSIEYDGLNRVARVLVQLPMSEPRP